MRMLENKFNFTAAIIRKDGQQRRKLKFAKMCNEFLTKAHDLDIPVNVLTLVLGSLVEGKGVHVDSVGEFFSALWTDWSKR